ncbi:threonine/serine exporter family protein [Clostridium sediminicola]|uniref:threonine/serine exporter family protein n=1 Tax=Clostridium sediminicola TaxID=3114879 RepID=UPI003D17E690
MASNYLYAFVCTLSFGVLFNIRGKKLFATSLGGGLGWVVYLILINMDISKVSALFVASIAVSIYSEAMARFLKNPVTLFAISAIIPLVPGSGMYYTMYEFIQGNADKALTLGAETFFSAGAIACGIILVSSVTRLINTKRYKNRRL